ncbi:MAG: imidazole glycerol phosphate synthase subunit HisH [Clostridia bacterium]|nr:imidazole glycerol phosphate synthase subunit HisH [Clostridia bacterium]
MTGIIDYGAGNLHSVRNALSFLGADLKLCTSAADLAECDRLILPGVGAFGPAMAQLARCGLVEALRAFAASGKPFLGICLGMQMLFDESMEFGIHAGLGLIPGKVIPIDAETLPVPHMGWNALDVRFATPCLSAEDAGRYVYFVHSFRADCADDFIAADSSYGERIPALVARGNVLGAQFHPEKSGTFGLSILKRFLAM